MHGNAIGKTKKNVVPGCTKQSPRMAADTNDHGLKNTSSKLVKVPAQA